jgi:hypothetical protein
MKRRTISKSIEIDAPGKKVWEVLLNPDYANIWTSEFSEGSRVEGDFSVGGTVFYKDKDGNGLKGRVADKKPNELLRVVIEGVLNMGIEDPENAEFGKWKGCADAYMLSERDGVTVLSIESDVPEEYFEPFEPLWDKSLRKIKQLSEW